MYNLIEYSNNYAKKSGSLSKYYKDDQNHNIVQSESFKLKINITGKNPGADNKKDVKITVSLKYLSKFWRTLEIPLVICDINLILTWPKNYLISSATGKKNLQ